MEYETKRDELLSMVETTSDLLYVLRLLCVTHERSTSASIENIGVNYDNDTITIDYQWYSSRWNNSGPGTLTISFKDVIDMYDQIPRST